MDSHIKLSPEMAETTKKHLERVIGDIFRLMFNLDLSSSEASSAGKKDTISAFLLLKHEKVSACVSIHVLRKTAILIAERIGMSDPKNVTPAILQDVACEIVNIVGNNLRTYLLKEIGVYFEIGNAVADKAELGDLTTPIVFDLDFQVSPEALLSLGFECGELPKA